MNKGDILDLGARKFVKNKIVPFFLDTKTEYASHFNYSLKSIYRDTFSELSEKKSQVFFLAEYTNMNNVSKLRYLKVFRVKNGLLRSSRYWMFPTCKHSGQ